MKFYDTFIMTLLAIFCLMSCECTKVDCAIYFPEMYFRIVDMDDTIDLIFDEDGIYDPSAMRMFSVENDDTSFYQIAVDDRDIFTRRVLTFAMEPPEDRRIFLDFGNEDVDTLDVSFETVPEDQCCQAYQRLLSVHHNGLEIHNRDSPVFWTLRK